MDFKSVLESGERYAARVHLLVWIAGGAISISTSVMSAISAYAAGFPWPLVALAAIGGFVVAAVVIAVVVWVAVWAWRVCCDFITAQPDAPPLALDQRGPEGPDWPLHRLFLHIDPKIFEDRKFREGDTVQDKLSTGQLASWGRKIVGSKRLALAPIPASFWADAAFVYPLTDNENPSVWDARSATGGDYADIRVNRAQALTLWPASSLSLQAAAAELYGAIADTTLGKNTKDNSASEDEIWDAIGSLIINRGAVTGRRPGSSQVENLGKAALWYARLVGGAKIVRANTTEKKTNYTDLKITRAELDRIIEDVKSIANDVRN